MIPHGLGGVPDLVIIKQLDNVSATWHVLHQGHAFGTFEGYFRLNSNVAFVVDSNSFPAVPTTHHVHTGLTVFNGNGGAGTSYIMYCWKSVAGVSAFGYHADALGAVAGTTVGITGYCGFKPRFVMIKRINGVYGWFIYDSNRGGTASSDFYSLGDSDADEVEASARTVTFTSTGFYIDDYAGIGTSGGTYITAAFA